MAKNANTIEFLNEVLITYQNFIWSSLGMLFSPYKVNFKPI
jgi:hypothetical protein